jgi:tetratricopeptide (TPR) repeat protein
MPAQKPTGSERSGVILVVLFVSILVVSLPRPASSNNQRAASTAHCAAEGPAGSLKLISDQPASVVFINDVRQGVTDDTGTLEIRRIKPGAYRIRVRRLGYKTFAGRVNVPLRGVRLMRIKQRPSSDESELSFQQAEDRRDKGRNKDAVTEYLKALELRPLFPAARIGLARSYVSLQEFDNAEKQLMTAIAGGHGALPEAQTVLANLRRYQGLVDEAIVEYRKAIIQARGVSPEAHIGLAIALEEHGRLDEAIKEYRIGIPQDMDTEPILYYLLGNALEKGQRYGEAIQAYRCYLRLDPDGQYASAIESIIDRLKEEIEQGRQLIR